MHSRDEIYNVLVNILAEDFEVDIEDINLKSNLYEELDLDSIDAVDLVIKLRKITGKNISPEVFKEVRTVEDIVNEVEKLILN